MREKKKERSKSQKKKGSIYLVRKSTIEKTNKQEKVRNNKGDGTKTVLQKRDEQMKKEVFFFKKK